MREFNLIPEEFTQRLRLRDVLLRYGLALGILLAVCGGSSLYAQRFVADARAEIDALRAEQALTQREQERLSQLQKRKELLANDFLLLQSLSAGEPMPRLVAAIESAVPEGTVWFNSMQFRRAGIRAKDDPVTRQPSYFIMATEVTDFPKEWESMTHMTIHGEAQDHAALSNFVQRLFAQPMIDDVRVQRSSRGEDGVTFHLAVVVKTAQEAS